MRCVLDYRGIVQGLLTLFHQVDKGYTVTVQLILARIRRTSRQSRNANCGETRNHEATS